MAEEIKYPDNKGPGPQDSGNTNRKRAERWISEYKRSGFARHLLSECNKMTLDQVALITKLLIIDNLPETGRLPDTFFSVWQKSYNIFYDKISGTVNNLQRHITHIDAFLDDKYSFDALEHILSLWDPEIKDEFHKFVISFRLPEYFEYHEAHLKHIAEISEYHTFQRKFGKVRSKYDSYKPILYTILLEIKELPHKVLILLQLALFYSSGKNRRLNEFFKKKFSCKLNELYDDIDCENLGRRFNKLFEEIYGKKLLKLPAGELYKADDFKEMIYLAGKDTITGNLITSIFFWYNYKNYPENPDYKKIRDVISQWNTRFKEEARAILRR